MRGDDAFCRIARGEERAYVAYSDDEVMVILDRSPICKGHLLVISRDHYEGVDSAPPEVVSRAFLVAAAVTRYLRERLGAPGVNVGNEQRRPGGPGGLSLPRPRHTEVEGLPAPHIQRRGG